MGATITVRAATRDSLVEAEISDAGPGIPEADRERVLRRFVRLEASRSTPGTGLGLTLVQAIADLHDARSELADNHPGLQVTITFTEADVSNQSDQKGLPLGKAPTRRLR